MKKVLHVLSGMNAGGMEGMIMNYYRNIDRSKYQFEFLINDLGKVFYEDEIIKLGGKLHRAPSQRKNILKNHYCVRKILLENDYDVIHAHQGITYYYPLKCAKNVGVKNRIVHNHGINRGFLKYLKIYNNIYARNRISSLANNFIACSKTVLNHIFSKRVIQTNNYTILPNAIDVEKYKYNESARKKIRKELGINDEKVLIHIGTFTKPKNHHFLIEVFNEYLKYNPEAKLLLVGDGELKSVIKSLVLDLNIDKSVRFLGVRGDVSDLLSAADVMLFPSLFEGLPLTLIEGQASGINVISSNNVSDECAVTRLVRFVEIDSAKKWVAEIRKAKDVVDRTKYNKALLNTNFSIKKAVKQLEKIYDRY